MGFTVQVENRRKIKESGKIDKYLDFVREMKKLWNLKVTVILIVIDAPGTIAKEPGWETGGQRKNHNHPDHSTAETTLSLNE